mgnify:CR=1 FL=1
MGFATVGIIAIALGLGSIGGKVEDAEAHSYKLGDIAVGHIWMPPSDQADGAPIYGPILNRGSAPARLVGATTPAAKQVRIRSEQDGTVAWSEALELQPGKPFAFAAWRKHLWLSGLRRPLRPGDSVELILDFGAAGELPVTVVVEEASGY